jgi:hypothetical protein
MQPDKEFPKGVKCVCIEPTGQDFRMHVFEFENVQIGAITTHQNISFVIVFKIRHGPNMLLVGCQCSAL